MHDELAPTAILIPSLNRPGRIEATVRSAHDGTPEPHRLLFCVSDDQSKEILNRLGEWYLDDSDCEDRRYVTRMNKLYEHVTEPTMFMGSDDIVFHRGWLTEAYNVMTTGPSVVVVNDLLNPNGTQALIRTAYIAEQGGTIDGTGVLFHDGYRHNFADNEQFVTALARGEYARAPQSIVQHLHPLSGILDWDQTYLESNGGWDHDRALWERRLAAIRDYYASLAPTP